MEATALSWSDDGFIFFRSVNSSLKSRCLVFHQHHSTRSITLLRWKISSFFSKVLLLSLSFCALNYTLAAFCVWASISNKYTYLVDGCNVVSFFCNKNFEVIFCTKYLCSSTWTCFIDVSVVAVAFSPPLPCYILNISTMLCISSFVIKNIDLFDLIY